MLSDDADTEDVDENAYVENGAGYWVWATEAGDAGPVTVTPDP